jgi:hypothetical protein
VRTCEAMDMRVIHVRSSDDGRWLVQLGDRIEPLSEHACETDAERAALRRAADERDVRVLVHDRYNRVRALSQSLRA